VSANNIKIIGEKITKGLKQDSQNRVTSPMPAIERYILRMRVLLEFWIVNGNITMGKLKSSFLL
jgi:hypothetical protein